MTICRNCTSREFKLLFSILLFMCCLVTYGQQEHLMTIKPQQEVEINNRRFYIDKVIDKRPKKVGIGAVRVGDRLIKANFHQPFSRHLKNVFNELAPYQRFYIPLTIEIKHFSIKEKDTLKEDIGITEIEIEVFYRDSLSSISSIRSKKQKTATDITRKHPTIIVEALKDCLLQINKLELDTTIGKRVTPFIFTSNTRLTKGLYRTMTDLLTNTPETDVKFRIEKSYLRTKKYPRFEVFKAKSQKNVKNYFGFSDGNSFFLNVAQYAKTDKPHQFVKAKFTGEYIYFEDRVKQFTVAISFGLAGALLPVGEKKGIIIDTKSGQISIMTIDYLRVILKDYPELKTTYNKSDKKLSDKADILKKFNMVLADESKKR